MNELAIQVCKDVLSRLSNLQFAQERYFSRRFSDDITRLTEDWVENNCKVCLLGSLFLSFSRLAKKPYLRNVIKDQIEGYGSRFDVVCELSSIFDTDELSLIECLFEGKDIFDNLSYDDWCKVKKFRNSPSFNIQLPEIVRYVCENMIKNNGHFVLE